MKKIIINLLIVMVMVLIPNKVFAVELTEDNLRTALDGMKNLQITNEQGQKEDASIIDSYTLDTANKKLTIDYNSNTYVFDYTLGETPTFSYSNQYTSSTTYEEYENQSYDTLWMIPYIAVLNTQGVKIEDAVAYQIQLLMSLLDDLNENTLGPSFIIAEDGVSVTSPDEGVISKSEFGQFIVDYIKNNYANETTTFQDNASDLLNSFKLTKKVSDSTATSATLLYKLSVDTTKDFSTLSGLAEKLDLAPSNFEETIETTIESTKETTKLSQTTASQEIPVPNTALNFPKIIIVVGILITLLGMVFLLKYLKTTKIEEV